MRKLAHALALLLALSQISSPAHAKARHRSKHAKKELATASGIPKPDMEARALIRKKAPFVIEEPHRRTSLRVNKDGTFSQEPGTDTYGMQGHWKVSGGKLKIKWNTGEEYEYRVTFSGKTPLIVSHKPNAQGHYVLSSAGI